MARSEPESVEEARDRHRVMAELHRQHFDGLVRMAAILLGDTHAAEEAVQDGFAATFRSWARIRQPSKRLPYLRSAVMNAARNRLRAAGRLRLVGDHDDRPALTGDPEIEAALGDRQRRIVSELRRLPRRQRECLVLRYYAELSEAEIAETLRISKGSVKTHVHRGLRTLEDRLPEEDER